MQRAMLVEAVAPRREVGDDAPRRGATRPRRPLAGRTPLDGSRFDALARSLRPGNRRALAAAAAAGLAALLAPGREAGARRRCPVGTTRLANGTCAPRCGTGSPNCDERYGSFCALEVDPVASRLICVAAATNCAYLDVPCNRTGQCPRGTACASTGCGDRCHAISLV
jgi:hypothetical protein